MIFTFPINLNAADHPRPFASKGVLINSKPVGPMPMNSTLYVFAMFMNIVHKGKRYLHSN